MNFSGKGYIAKPPQVYDRGGYRLLVGSAGFRQFVGGQRKKEDGTPDNVVKTWVPYEIFGRLAEALEPELVQGATLLITAGYFITTQPREGEQFGHLLLRVTEAGVVPPMQYADQAPPPPPPPQRSPQQSRQNYPQQPRQPAPRQAQPARQAPRPAPQPQQRRAAPPRQAPPPPPVDDTDYGPPVNGQVVDEVPPPMDPNVGAVDDPDVPF